LENVSSRAEVHPKICDQLIEAYIGGWNFFIHKNGYCRYNKNPSFYVDSKNVNLPLWKNAPVKSNSKKTIFGLKIVPKKSIILK
jgi:hypothetical protein